MAETSRIAVARRNLRTLRLVVGGGSVAAFAAFVVVARAAHPGHTTARQPAAGSTAAAGDSDSGRQGGDFGFGNASIAPSQGGGFGQPQTSSGGS